MVDYFYNLFEDRTTTLDRSLFNINIFMILKILLDLNKIIPFFNKYPILGIKSLDFNDCFRVANFIQNKEHLTAKGFNQTE
jgi:LAGLIDADG endonuclease